MISFFQIDFVAWPSQLPASRRPRQRRLRRGAGALEQAEQLVRVARAVERDLGRDRPAQDELGKRLLHRLHPARGAGLHHRVDLLDLALADQVADGVVGEQDLERRDAALAVGGRQQRLRDDAFERAGELGAHLALLLGREDVDDAVDRPGRAARVQRAEDEVPGLGRGQRGRDRLEVAHLAEEDHVGVLAERGAQSASANPRASVPISRWLTMQRRCAVEELDRVLDREDVRRARCG